MKKNEQKNEGRKLKLNRETVRNLQQAELKEVVGGVTRLNCTLNCTVGCTVACNLTQTC